ncbi:MAG: nuclear transport factor 2 family protein [Deltaproteobacteria bacterium]|nr:nuclear transport factor 2 family protein [Deltaproteobacteria bacterium]MBI3390916.1 nuclear transport factor 2 family protein [Deltaproteobacteria bacterium]
MAKKPKKAPRAKAKAGKRPAAKKVAARRVIRKKVAKPAARKPAAKAAAAPKPAAPNPLRGLAQRIVELTLSQNDEASFALYSDSIESVEPGQPPAVGIEAIRQKFAMWRGMISDSSWRARSVWVDGSTIIIEWAGRVTFAATGKQAELNEVAIHEIANGKIVRERFYYDRGALQP